MEFGVIPDKREGVESPPPDLLGLTKTNKSADAATHVFTSANSFLYCKKASISIGIHSHETFDFLFKRRISNFQRILQFGLK